MPSIVKYGYTADNLNFTQTGAAEVSPPIACASAWQQDASTPHLYTPPWPGLQTLTDPNPAMTDGCSANSMPRACLSALSTCMQIYDQIYLDALAAKAGYPFIATNYTSPILHNVNLPQLKPTTTCAPHPLAILSTLT